jgi:hypothetical protein
VTGKFCNRSASRSMHHIGDLKIKNGSSHAESAHAPQVNASASYPPLRGCSSRPQFSTFPARLECLLVRWQIVVGVQRVAWIRVRAWVILIAGLTGLSTSQTCIVRDSIDNHNGRCFARPSASHSRCDQFGTRYPKASPPLRLRLLPAKTHVGWDLHPLESAALSRRTPFTEAILHLTDPLGRDTIDLSIGKR